MTKLRYYQLIIGLLIGLNIFTCFFLWPRHHSPHGRPPKDLLVDHLNVTGKKRTLILNMQEAHFGRKEQLMDENHRLHLRLYHLARLNNVDTVLRNHYLLEIGTIQQKIDKETFDYFRSVNRLCNEEQKKKLGEMLQRVFVHPNGHPPKKD
jgi:hypothetical protein